jgi:hypothetical protein
MRAAAGPVDRRDLADLADLAHLAHLAAPPASARFLSSAQAR